jgi:hypothetical protein
MCSWSCYQRRRCWNSFRNYFCRRRKVFFAFQQTTLARAKDNFVNLLKVSTLEVDRSTDASGPKLKNRSTKTRGLSENDEPLENDRSQHR